MRYVEDKKLRKRARKSMSADAYDRAFNLLKKLEQVPPPSFLRLKPMEGHNGVLWEMRGGGQYRFILKRCRDEIGDYLLVKDVGPHDIYDSYRPGKR